MTTVASTAVALTEATFGPAPAGSSQAAEQNGDVTNGNKFAGGPGKYLIARNTTGAPVGVDIFADFAGAEIKLVDGSVTANKVPANGVRVYGPFTDPRILDHTTTASAQNGQVTFKQTSGIAGDVKYSPMQLDRG